jgi:hypothetical protein
MLCYWYCHAASHRTSTPAACRTQHHVMSLRAAAHCSKYWQNDVNCIALSTPELICILSLFRVAMVSFGCMQHKLQYRFFIGVIEPPPEFRKLPAHTMLDLSTTFLVDLQYYQLRIRSCPNIHQCIPDAQVKATKGLRLFPRTKCYELTSESRKQRNANTP